MGSERRFEDLVREGVERMRQRREAERQAAELAEQDPEAAAAKLVEFAWEERTRLRRELEERFGTTVVWGREGLRFRFSSPGRAPRTPDRAARFVDLIITLSGFELAREAMRHAAACFPEPDRARKVCHAFLDVMKDVPAAYNAFASSGFFDPPVREYASAMAAAWTRSHLKAFPGSKTEVALRSEGWARELANAAALAWPELRPDAPIKRGTRFRDTLPKQKGGRRQKAPGPPDLINLVGRVLEGRDVGREAQPQETPEEVGLAEFAVQEMLLKRAREAGLAPREMEVFKVFVENPGITNRQVAERLRVSVGTVKKAKNRIRAALVGVA